MSRPAEHSVAGNDNPVTDPTEDRYGFTVPGEKLADATGRSRFCPARDGPAVNSEPFTHPCIMAQSAAASEGNNSDHHYSSLDIFSDSAGMSRL